MAAGFDVEAGLVGEVRRAPAALGRARPRGDAATSIRAMASAVAVIRGAEATASAVSSSACAASAASACAPASTTRLASSCSSGELKRTTPASVWRWVKPLSGAISLSACRADDFDMIAEHGIVADLERRDAGRVAVAAFERGDGAAAVGRGGAQGVERGVIAFGDVAALARVDRRRFDQRLAAACRSAPHARRDAAADGRAAMGGRVRCPGPAGAPLPPSGRRAGRRGRAGFRVRR